MKFDINNYKGNYAMHCKTEEEAKSFCKYLHEHGKTWCIGQSYIEENRWDMYSENTVYYFNRGTYSSIGCARNEDYTILEWEDFMTNTFTKADLKTGDIIKTRCGEVGIVVLKYNVIAFSDGYQELNYYKDDLTYGLDKFASHNDIVAVRRPRFDEDCGDLVYKRPEVEEMTLAEVCKLLGREIKIIK